MQQPEEFDSGDLDALLELERSPGYALVKARIEAELARKLISLEGDGEPLRTRGELAALRVALAIPGILKQEIKAKL